MKAFRGWKPRPLAALRHLSVWSALTVPRVTVFRSNPASMVYHTGKIVFSEDCGLWFGVEWRRPDLLLDPQGGLTFQGAFRNALAALRDDGLGGERTSGYGAFETREGAPVALADSEPGRLIYLLSRYHPREEELPSALVAPGAAYRLVAVSGWLSTLHGEAQRRKRLFLVGEGSLVHPGASPAGDIADLRPEHETGPAFPHPVYRYGLALGVPWPEMEASHA
jgi:CRISPR-associated protein Csm4